MRGFAYIYEDPDYDLDQHTDIDEQDMSPEAYLPHEQFNPFDTINS